MGSMVIGWPTYQPSVNGSETMPGRVKRGFFAFFPVDRYGGVAIIL